MSLQGYTAEIIIKAEKTETILDEFNSGGVSGVARLLFCPGHYSCFHTALLIKRKKTLYQLRKKGLNE